MHVNVGVSGWRDETLGFVCAAYLASVRVKPADVSARHISSLRLLLGCVPGIICSFEFALFPSNHLRNFGLNLIRERENGDITRATLRKTSSDVGNVNVK